MRLLIKLKSISGSYFPVNYNHPLSSIIYKLLQTGSPEFSRFLHDEGYIAENKKYKMFSFALQFEKFKIENEKVKLLSPYLKLFVSSPLDKKFFGNILAGSFTEKKLEVVFDGIKTVLEPYMIEQLPEPEIGEFNKFQMLSPLVLSTKKEQNGILRQQYLTVKDSSEEINRILNMNLKRKFKIVYGKEFEGEDCELRWDEKYLERNRNKNLTRLVKVKDNNDSKIYLRAIVSPFYLSGSKELIKIGYMCGFGEKNSMGFGLVKKVG